MREVSADFLFHEAIVRAAHSPVLMNVYAAISDLMMRSHLDRREQIIKVEGINEFSPLIITAQFSGLCSIVTRQEQTEFARPIISKSVSEFQTPRHNTGGQRAIPNRTLKSAL